MERRKFLKAGEAMAGALALESGLYPWRIPITLAGEWQWISARHGGVSAS